MKAIGIIIGIIILLVVGFVGGQVLLGTGAGVGIASGLMVGSQAGICLAVQSAQDQGFINAQQADQVIKKVVGKVSGGFKPEASDKIKWITDLKDCSEMIAKMNEGAKK